MLWHPGWIGLCGLLVGCGPVRSQPDAGTGGDAQPVDARPIDARVDAMVDAPPPGHTVPANPTIWLRFDDAPADGVLDSGTGHTATCTSCPALVTGKFAGAYQFTGTNRVDVAAGADLGPGVGFTVAAWVRIDTAPTSVGVIGCKNQGTLDCTYALLMSATSTPTYHSANATQAAAAAAIQLGAWHHMAMTWNGANRIGYVDGVMATNVATATMVNDAATVLSIGARNASPALTFSGSIDDFVYYNRVLSATELTQLATP